MDKQKILKSCQKLLRAYQLGKLGDTTMPEDSSPIFSNNQKEERLAYFTLPMALNYQRDSYNLWKSTLKTWEDEKTRIVFDIKKVSEINKEELKENLLKYKLALQPNKHINTWKTISETIFNNWGSIFGLIKFIDDDFLKLKYIIQKEYKKGFPYLSGPKIFNYWAFILMKYGKIPLKNKNFIEIAPDTHITKCSVLLGVITKKEAEILPKEEISQKWRKLLEDSEINPIDMHPPLWFWSKNNFIYKL